MNRNSDIDALMRAANPVHRPTGTQAEKLNEGALNELQTILSIPRGEASDPMVSVLTHKRTLMTAAAALVIVAVLSAALALRGGRGQGGSAYAATPPILAYQPLTDQSDAPALLQSLADRVVTLPDDTGSGKYARMEWRSWSLFTSVSEGDTKSEVVPQQSTLLLADDGSGRLTVRGTTGEIERDEDLPPGSHKLAWPQHSLPTEVAVLEDGLAQSMPRSNGPGGRMAAVRDLAQRVPLAPLTRATVLRYLAATPGIQVSGAVTDRGGRPGIGFHVDSTYGGLPNRMTIIVHPQDGTLLASETVLTETPGQLRVTIPAVIDYSVFESAKFTDSI